MVRLMLLLPPVLVLLLAVHLASAAVPNEHVIAVLDTVAEDEANKASELFRMKHTKALNSALLQVSRARAHKYEEYFSLTCNTSSERLAMMWEDFREEQELIDKRLAERLNQLKNFEDEEPVKKPEQITLLRHLWNQFEERYLKNGHLVLITRRILEERAPKQNGDLAAKNTVPSNPTPPQSIAGEEEIDSLPAKDKGYPRGAIHSLHFDGPSSTGSAGSFHSLVNEPSTSSLSATPLSTKISAPRSPPKLSPEELRQQKEKEEKGNKALAELDDTYLQKQLQALENEGILLSSPLEDLLAASRPSPTTVGATTTLQPSNSALPLPTTSQATITPKKSVQRSILDETPSLTVPLRTDPIQNQANGGKRPEPEVVSDDELMEELMDVPKVPRAPIHPISRPELTQAQQLPSSQFPPQAQVPKLPLREDIIHFTPTKMLPEVRTESELTLRGAMPTPNISPIPISIPAISPRDTLADSLSQRKNSLRGRAYVEPDEPEPQPIATSLAVVTRQRSTSVGNDAQPSSRPTRAERGTHTASPPTVKKGIYRKELESSQDPDSASKPRRESLEMSDTFESEAESQPSDSERDSD